MKGTDSHFHKIYYLNALKFFVVFTGYAGANTQSAFNDTPARVRDNMISYSNNF